MGFIASSSSVVRYCLGCTLSSLSMIIALCGENPLNEALKALESIEAIDICVAGVRNSVSELNNTRGGVFSGRYAICVNGKYEICNVVDSKMCIHK